MNLPMHRAAFGGATATAALVLGPAALFVQGATDAAEALPVLAWSVAATALMLAAAPRLWIGLLLLLPCALWAPLELAYVAAYSRPSDAHTLGILSETHWREAADFLGPWATPLIAAVLGSALLALASAWAAYRTRLRWAPRIRRWLLLASMLALATPLLLRLADAEAPLGLGVATAAEGDALAEFGIDPVLASMTAAYPAGLPLRLLEYARYQRTLAELSGRLADFRFGAQPASTAAARQVHVLVIGETGRPDRWQINGYDRPTSPRLAAQPGLTSLTDMVSPWAWTRMSVPVILTRKPGTESRPFFAERSLISAFREAGFRTYWFSTQSPLGTHDSSIALHAQEAHEQRFINPGSYKERAALDGELLPLLDRVLARDEPRQLIVLHTLGSHYNYSHRVPPEFERFLPSLRDHPSPSLQDRSQRERLSNAYDNSVLYTDHVLAEVIARLDRPGLQASMFYVADHGENLFDGECNKSGHGRHTEFDFRVAAFVWQSAAQIAQQPAKAALLQERRQARLSTENVFHSLLDLADIRYPGERPDASLFSPSWQPRRRGVQNGLDFDLAERDPACKELTPPRRSPH